MNPRKTIIENRMDENNSESLWAFEEELELSETNGIDTPDRHVSFRLIQARAALEQW